MARLLHTQQQTILMKRILFIVFTFFYTSIHAQDTTSAVKLTDTTQLGKPDNTRIIDRTIYDTTIDYRPKNKYGDLLNDDPEYNKKYPWYVPAIRVAGVNVFNWAIDKYLFHFEWANISAQTWKDNLKHGWEWDNDHFGTNFIGHPHSGNLYFNVARSNGYSFWGSIPYAIGGSLMWEYFGENTSPSRNDLINTPFSGIFLGEVVYRISSNILDDRARGASRVWREILAGIINPPRALNRLTQGKMFRVTSKEVYQKEPLNITFSGGIHKINTNNKFGTGLTNAVFNLQLDYGDPFEVRHRKPFDVFRFRTESSFGIRKKILGNVQGYGLLFGKNIVTSKNGTLIGGFQYFDYWNNPVFELGALGFGAGLISELPVSKHSGLYSSLHLAAVPLAGNNTGYGPDSSKFRDYNFGGGMEAKIEETLHLSTIADIGFSGYYYWIHNYENLTGKSIIGILKPRLTLNFSRSFSVGLEHQIFYVTRYLQNIPTLHLTRTEQKLFLQIFLEDRRRSGRYH
jgi:hypothetical protein